MSLAGQIIRCDAPRCPRALRWPARTRPSPPDLRHWAMSHHGWSRDERGGDRCPEHAVRLEPAVRPNTGDPTESG